MNNLLIDADVMIDYLRGLPAARRFFQIASNENTLYLSVVVLAEIYAGKDTKNLQKLREIEQFLSNFEISLITPTIAKLAGILKRDYNRPFTDMLVAATALEYNFALVSRNIKHFKGLPKLILTKPYG